MRHIGIPVAAALALVFCVRETTTVLARDVTGVNAAIPSSLGTPNPPRAWVDKALSRTAGDAGALESPLANADSYGVWLWLEFWNKSITRLYVPAGGKPYSGLPSLSFELDEETGAIRTPLEKPYLVVAASDARLGVQGSAFATGPYGLVILKPRRPYRAAWAALAGKPGGLAVYRPAGSSDADPVTLDVRFTVTPTGGQTSRAVTRRTTIAAGAPRSVIKLGARRVAIRDVVVSRAD